MPRNESSMKKESSHLWRSRAFRSPMAWGLVIFFGFESASYYASATWLPTILHDKGYSLSGAGIAVSVSVVIGSLIGLVVPHYADKLPDQRLFLVLMAAFTGFAFFMMTVNSGALLILWLCISNIGISISFPMALVLTVSKSTTPDATRNLSTMMQSFGYLISAFGPAFAAMLFDLSKNWNIALYGITGLCLVQLFAAIYVGKPSYVE